MAGWFAGAMGRPRTSSAPPVGGAKQVTILIVVVFPAPFGPRRPSVSPDATAKVRSSTTRREP